MEQSDLAMIADGLERILTDAPLEAMDHAGGVDAHSDALWNNLSEAGYPKLCVSQEHGGFGGTFADAASLAQIVARHAVALPLTDTIFASGLLSECGVETPDLRIAIADPLDPSAPIPHAAQVDAVLRCGEGKVTLERLSETEIIPQAKAEDGAGFWSGVGGDVIAEGTAPGWLNARSFQAIAAFSRAASMAGALEAVLSLTLSYTQEREQFGRPLAKFQAIQHHLADIACETAASMAAVEMASDAITGDPLCGTYILDEIAIAKIRCGEAVSRVSAAAHQAHGAMGFTREYALGRYTRRLWQWQDEFGSEALWAERLGSNILAEESPVLWPRISRPI